jgi:CRP/FNR family transcriptional regulator
MSTPPNPANAFVISANLKAAFERLGAVVTKSKGAVLFRRGDPVSGLFLIRKGELALELDPASQIYPPHALGPGTVAGLPATVTGAAYSLTARVMEDSELSYVPRPRVLKLLANDPRLCLLAMQTVSAEISRMRAAVKNR